MKEVGIEDGGARLAASCRGEKTRSKKRDGASWKRIWWRGRWSISGSVATAVTRIYSLATTFAVGLRISLRVVA
jgi:hypothetical protein